MYKNTKPILITGGHLTPALAILSELKKRGYTNFIWVGHKYNQYRDKSLSPEYRTIKLLNIPFIELKSGKIIRSFKLKELPFVLFQYLLILNGLISSLFIILRYKPNIVLSFGGYLAVPVAIMGKLFNKLIITHEQTIVSGSANKILARLSNKTLISWENSFKYFKKDKTVLTGNPIRKEVLKGDNVKLTKGLRTNIPTLLVMGGNQGSHVINKTLFHSLNELIKDFNIIHQTGSSSATNDFSKAQTLKKELPLEFRDRYLTFDYISTDDIGEVLNKSDLIISRSGANTISEILLLAKPAILIPIPWASHNEQYMNARLVQSCGLGVIIDEKNLNKASLISSIYTSLNNIKMNKGLDNRNLDICKKDAQALINIDAHIKIVDEIEKLLKN